MDSYNIRTRLKVLKACCDRVLPFFPAFHNSDGLLEAGGPHELAYFLHGFPRRRDDDVINRCREIEFPNCMDNDRGAVQCKKLLRTIRFHTPSEPSRSDDGADLHKRNSRERSVRYF